MAHTKTIRQAKNIWICYALDTKKYNYNNYGVLRMVRKVKLILGWTMFLDLGKLCNRFLCVASFIISKLPCSSTSEIICLVCLCLNKGYKNILLLDMKGHPPKPLEYQSRSMIKSL